MSRSPVYTTADLIHALRDLSAAIRDARAVADVPDFTGTVRAEAVRRTVDRISDALDHADRVLDYLDDADAEDEGEE